ncbi:hypothetical protein [Vibrio crassostreae]|uniref:hypothetical protein n=1 Tax=Vibrio crassostreae TaxID=246167 RepID=UPI0006382E55|nr:hypothetical protein [Vibrio crassostreae]CDT76717.1 exported hypothetical protein [Vibrio crassostreae]
MTKTLIGTVLAIGLALMGFSESGDDYTQIVADNEKLAKVFEDLDVSNPNGFQVLMVQLCSAVESCGKE